MPDLPSGTVTFLFTDVEGSTRLLQAHPDAYRLAVSRHHDLLQHAVEAHGGVVFETVGDAVYAAFAQATDAAGAALAGQRALQGEDWGETGPLTVRMGLHTGEVELQGSHYFGAPLYRCARLMAVAHGGQVVLSEVTAGLVRDALPEGAGLQDLGAHRLKDLQRPERVFDLVHPDLPVDFPPLRSLDARPNNLPVQVTSFVGRELELAAVTRLLRRHRLVTLTGPGGTGKTRLAHHVTAELLPDYPDGVWLVELASLSDPGLVPQAVASTLHVREEPGRPVLATLTGALRPEHVLLLLDNCEHLLDACARLADALLRACPTLTIVATSREALGIAGEMVWLVPSLSLPDPRGTEHSLPVEALRQYEAVRLFVDRAMAVHPVFQVTTQNAPAVARICQRLDGIPLALEFAAVRVRVLPPEQLLGRLQDRFRLLTGGSRTALERHQTLQAAVDWSYDLLTPQEQTLLARLAVFAGGWTLEAAEAVCAGDGIEPAAVLDLLTRLVDKSLVVAEEQADGTARYRLLETLRQYAQQKLAAPAEAGALRQRHAGFYLALAEAAALALRDFDSEATLQRLEREHDNLRTALQSAIQRSDVAAALGLAGALWRFWEVRTYWTEGRTDLEQVLALAGGVEIADRRTDDQVAPAAPRSAVEPARRAQVLLGAGALAYMQGDFAAAHARCTEALSLWQDLGDASGRAWCLLYLGWMGTDTGQYAAAQPLLEESLVLHRRVGDIQGVIRVLNVLGYGAFFECDFASARSRCSEALALARRAGHRWGIAWSLRHLAATAIGEANPGAARPLIEESLALYRALGDQHHTAMSLSVFGMVAFAEGDLGTARRVWTEVLGIAAALSDWILLPLTLTFFAALAAAQREPIRAFRLMGSAAGLTQLGGPAAPFFVRLWEAWLAPARTALASDAQAKAWADGQAMSLEQAVAYALEQAPTAPAEAGAARTG